MNRGWLTITRLPIPIPCRWPVGIERIADDLNAIVGRCGDPAGWQVGADGGPFSRERIPGSALCPLHLLALLGDEHDEAMRICEPLGPLETVAVARIADDEHFPDLPILD